MDVRYINPFMKSIRNVFGTMLSVEVQFDKPHVTTENNGKPDVSGVIGFSGDATGAVVLSFGKQAAARTVSKFAGADLDIDNPDFADAIGELANMVAGGAKADFGGLNVNISLPSVIIGDGHALSRSHAHSRLVIPCQTPLGPFDVSVSMEIHQPVAAGAA